MKKTLKAIVATTAVSTLGLLPLVASAPAFAGGSATANFAVTATVGDNCAISASALPFANYDSLSAADTTATSQVTITCTKGANAKIGLNKGARSNRTMISGANLLSYELYKPDLSSGACTTTVWGDTGAGTLDPEAAPSKAARNYNVCGKITAGQDVPAGTYSDSVTATVNF